MSSRKEKAAFVDWPSWMISEMVGRMTNIRKMGMKSEDEENDILFVWSLLDKKMNLVIEHHMWQYFCWTCVQRERGYGDDFWKWPKYVLKGLVIEVRSFMIFFQNVYVDYVKFVERLNLLNAFFHATFSRNQFCTASFNRVWTYILCSFKSCL